MPYVRGELTKKLVTSDSLILATTDNAQLTMIAVSKQNAGAPEGKYVETAAVVRYAATFQQLYDAINANNRVRVDVFFNAANNVVTDFQWAPLA